MVAGTCAEFLGSVKQHFAYLFDRYGFEVVDCDQPTAGRFLVVMESAECRIRLIQNLWDLEMALGPRSAPISEADSIEGVRYWYPVRAVSRFLEERGKQVDIEELMRDRPFLTIDEQLAKLSEELEPLVDRAQRVFQSSAFTQKQIELDRFLEEERQQLGRQLKEWEKRKRREPDNGEVGAPSNDARP